MDLKECCVVLSIQYSAILVHTNICKQFTAVLGATWPG